MLSTTLLASIETLVLFDFSVFSFLSTLQTFFFFFWKKVGTSMTSGGSQDSINKKRV